MCNVLLMEKLANYLTQNQISNRDLADLLGVNHSTAWRLATGKIRPSIDMAAKIAQITQGAVPVESWARGQV